MKKSRQSYNINELISFFFIGILYLISLLPLSVLYLFSSFMYFIWYHVIKYRRSVIRQNLKNAFPHKTEEERRVIERKYYRHLSHLMAENVKLATISREELKRRVRYEPESVAFLNELHRQGRSIMIVMAHTGNWEWAGAAFPLYQDHQVITAYRPLRNKAFDWFMLKIRSRTGNIITPMKVLPREMLKLRKTVTATALIGDQNPPINNAFWVYFLNQETPFYKGTEVLSRKFDYPVVWGNVKKAGRGYYDVVLELITDKPDSFEKEGILTALHASYLERDILEQPECWLWSHRRWKKSRPAGEPLIKAEKV